MAILGHQNCHAKPIGTPRNTEIQLTKGASIYDVHTEGRGGHKIPQICGQTVDKIRTGGVKNLRTSCMEPPTTNSLSPSGSPSRHSQNGGGRRVVQQERAVGRRRRRWRHQEKGNGEDPRGQQGECLFVWELLTWFHLLLLSPVVELRIGFVLVMNFWVPPNCEPCKIVW